MLGGRKIVLVSFDINATEKVVQHMQTVGITLDGIIENSGDIYKMPRDIPAVVLLVEPGGDTGVKDVVKLLLEINRRGTVILLLKNVNYTVMKESFKAGVKDVLRFPEELPLLEKAVQEAARSAAAGGEKASLTAGQSGRDGKVISFFSVKGGCGTTFLAINTAQALRLQTKKKVLLIDLCLQFGGVQNMLNLKGQRNIADLEPVMHELDENHINNVLFTLEPSGLNVLLGPARPEIAEVITDDHIELLLAACRKIFDYVVIDLPSELNRASLVALQESDEIIYVLTPDSPSLLSFKQAREFFASYGLDGGGRLKVAVNRTGKVSDLDYKEIAEMANLTVIGGVRSDYRAVKRAVNIGRPLVGSDEGFFTSGIIKDIFNLSARLTG